MQPQAGDNSTPGAPQQPQQTTQPNAQPPVGNTKTNTLAIWGLVLAFFIPILGLILSIVAKSQIKKSGEGGNGLATAGIIISVIYMVITVLIVIMIMLLAVTDIQSEKRNSTSNPSNSSTSTTNTSSYSADEKKAVTSAEAFLRALSKNDKAGAYLVLSPEFKAQLTRSEFDSKIENSNLKITDWSISSVTTNGNGDRITIKGTLDLSSGSENGEFELILYKGTDASIGIIQFDLHSN